MKVRTMKVRTSDSTDGLFKNLFETLYVFGSAMSEDVDLKIGQATFTLKQSVEYAEFGDFVYRIKNKIIQLIALGEEEIAIKADERVQIKVDVWRKSKSNERLYTVSIGLVEGDINLP